MVRAALADEGIDLSACVVRPHTRQHSASPSRTRPARATSFTPAAFTACCKDGRQSTPCALPRPPPRSSANSSVGGRGFRPWSAPWRWHDRYRRADIGNAGAVPEGKSHGPYFRRLSMRS
jgi:hypothetical protein